MSLLGNDAGILSFIFIPKIMYLRKGLAEGVAVGESIMRETARRAKTREVSRRESVTSEALRADYSSEASGSGESPKFSLRRLHGSVVSDDRRSGIVDSIIEETSEDLRFATESDSSPVKLTPPRNSSARERKRELERKASPDASWDGGSSPSSSNAGRSYPSDKADPISTVQEHDRILERTNRLMEQHERMLEATREIMVEHQRMKDGLVQSSQGELVDNEAKSKESPSVEDMVLPVKNDAATDMMASFSRPLDEAFQGGVSQADSLMDHEPDDSVPAPEGPKGPMLEMQQRKEQAQHHRVVPSSIDVITS